MHDALERHAMRTYPARSRVQPSKGGIIQTKTLAAHGTRCGAGFRPDSPQHWRKQRKIAPAEGNIQFDSVCRHRVAGGSQHGMPMTREQRVRCSDAMPVCGSVGRGCGRRTRTILLAMRRDVAMARREAVARVADEDRWQLRALHQEASSDFIFHQTPARPA